MVHRRDTDSVDAAERPTDEHYRRFLTLVRRGTAVGWNQERLAREGGFRVLDPGFSAILARAGADLAWLADRLGEGRIAEESLAASERVIAALRARVDSDGLIRAVDTIDSSTLAVTSAGSALAGADPRAGAARAAGGARAGRGRPARVALRRALARRRPPAALGAQLLARPGLGERDLAVRPGAGGARRAGAGGRAAPADARRRSRAAGCASTSRRSPAAAWARATSPGPPRCTCGRLARGDGQANHLLFAPEDVGGAAKRARRGSIVVIVVSSSSGWRWPSSSPRTRPAPSRADPSEALGGTGGVRLGFAVKVLGDGGLPSHDTRRWQSGPAPAHLARAAARDPRLPRPQRHPDVPHGHRAGALREPPRADPVPRAG